MDGYLFKENRLCVSISYLRKLLVYEAHGVVQWVVLGLQKLWMYCMNISISQRWKGICNESVSSTLHVERKKSRVQLYGLYTKPWVYISMDFVLGLPMSKKKKVETPFLLWLIGFLRSRISFHAIRLLMHLISQICYLERLYVCIAFLGV
jgi:hypothetical protein